MSTSSSVQIPEESLDQKGLSVVTSTRTGVGHREGMIYNPTYLAAATLVHLHPLNDGRALALFRERWTAATPSTTVAQAYTAYTQETSPSWVVVDPTYGTTSAVSGQTYLIPTSFSGTSRLEAACSRSDFLYTLLTIDGTPVVQFIRASKMGSITLETEETFPPVTIDGDTVTFNRGCFIHDPYLMLVGSRDSDGALFFARKTWGRVGVGNVPWEYQTVNGWSTDSTEAAPVDLVTSGPVSVVEYQGRVYLSVVHDVSGTYTSKVYKSRSLFGPWKLETTSVALGDTDHYLGGGAYFQPQLGSNAANEVVAASTNLTAIPYVKSVKTVDGDIEGISTSWGLWPIARKF